MSNFDDFDEIPQDASDDIPSAWYSQSIDYDDDYDRYEDWYSESGYDPYHLFSDEYEPNMLYRLKTRIRAVYRAVKYRLKIRFSAKFRAQMDDIPF